MDKENAKITLSWEIIDYDLADFTDGKFIVSPVFNLDKLNSTKWVLKLRLEGENLTFQLVRCEADKGPDKIPLCCSLYLVGHEDQMLICACKELSFQRNDMLRGSLELHELIGNKFLHWSRNVLKIQCNMNGHLLSDICPVSYIGKTDVLTSTFEFQWKANLHNSECLDSPRVSYSNETFCYVTLVRYCDENEIYCQIDGSASCSVCVIHFVDANQRQLSHPSFVLRKGFYIPDTLNCVSESFLSEKDCYNNTNGFNLNCKFRISNGSYISRDVREFPSPVFTVISCGQSLMTGLRKMYSEQSLCDFSLQTDEGEVFNVHSLILASRSPVFHRMFSSDMKETNTKVMTIVDTGAETIRSFLNFVYGYEMDLNLNAARKLYIMADKYDVSELKVICATFLVKNVSIDNVCDTLELADRHSDLEMKKVILSFISSNTESVLSSDQWKNFQETNLLMALDVLKVLALKK